MKGLGLTSSQVASGVGMDEAEFAKIRSGEVLPDDGVCQKIASTLALGGDKLARAVRGGYIPKPVDTEHADYYVESLDIRPGTFASNCYLLVCKKTNKCAVVDPGIPAEDIRDRLHTLSVELDLVLITHSHGDHANGMRRQRTMWREVRTACRTVDIISSFRDLMLVWEETKEGIPIRLGALEIYPVHTPGHTPDSVCYICRDVCFTGDTLFAGSIGKPENSAVYTPMLENIRNKVLSQPVNTVIFPGHGSASTVGSEIDNNPFF